MLQTVSYRVSKELFAYADTADAYVQCNGPFSMLIYAEFVRIISAYPTSLYGLDSFPDCCYQQKYSFCYTHALSIIAAT